MIRPLDRFGFRLRDWLCYARLPREAAGLVHQMRSGLARDPAVKLGRAIDAYRFSGLRAVRNRALRTLRDKVADPLWTERKIGWERYAAQLESPALTRSVILKEPAANGEKGVLLVTFEYNWLRLLAGIPDPRSLARHYDIVFSTSSSPTNYKMLALALASLEGTVFVQACNHGEIADIEAMHPRLRCLPMLPCDWLDPGLFAPRPRAQRDIDILMVANWDPVKRHWQFFEALRSMDPSLRVVLVGQKADRFDLEFARRSARLFGAPQQIEFHQSLAIEEVAALQCRSRISTIFSRREGCCVAVTESLFADTPVALLADAHIGPKAYINPRTGVLLDRRGKIGRQLQAFLDRSDEFRPRQWAEANISARISTDKLNRLLREHAAREGRPWTKDLVVPCWRAHPTLLHNPEAARLRPAYAALHAAYPGLFPADLFETSYR